MLEEVSREVEKSRVYGAGCDCEVLDMLKLQFEDTMRNLGAELGMSRSF
jgi:hypothetical protein